MRLLRIGSLLFFVLAVIFSVWVELSDLQDRNTDLPTITSDTETLSLSVEDGQEGLLRGLYASDPTDGDLTEDIMIASVSHFLSPGLVKVKYVVFDAHNHSATLERRVQYTDYTPPRFFLREKAVYQVGESFDLLSRVGAVDAIEGDISDRVRLVTSTVSSYQAGTYPVTLEVSNSFGDTERITLYVTYQKEADEVQVVLHESVCYVEKGGEFDPVPLLAAVYDSSHKALDAEKVKVLGTVDTDTPGCYQLSFSYDDGSLQGSAPLTVVVREGGSNGN